MQLEGKVELVTGSSRGIVKTIARELARRGCTLIVHGSNECDCITGTSITVGGGLTLGFCASRLDL